MSPEVVGGQHATVCIIGQHLVVHQAELGTEANRVRSAETVCSVGMLNSKIAAQARIRAGRKLSAQPPIPWSWRTPRKCNQTHLRLGPDLNQMPTHVHSSRRPLWKQSATVGSRRRSSLLWH